MKSEDKIVMSVLKLYDLYISGYGMDSSKTGFDRMSRSTKEGPDGKIEKRVSLT